MPYIYKVIATNGFAERLRFSIEVYSSVYVEYDTVAESFAVRGSYPNPFQQSTRLEFKLFWRARVIVEVLDIMSRRPVAPGWGSWN